MIVLKNVLVATDFSDASRVALDYGRDLARAYGAILHVLYVVEDLTSRYAGELGVAPPELQAELLVRGRAALNKLVTDDYRASVRLLPVVQVSTSVPHAITEYARSHRIDLIVTGTHGRGPIKHLFMGSVAERVVRTAPCPVLTVRSPEREFIVQDQLETASAAS